MAQEGARISELAASSGLTPSAMTRVLEKLEARGLVERVRGAQDDGRAALVRITTPGRRTRVRLDGLMVERARRIMAQVPVAERAPVLHALATLNHAIETAGYSAAGATCAPPRQRREVK